MSPHAIVPSIAWLDPGGNREPPDWRNSTRPPPGVAASRGDPPGSPPTSQRHLMPEAGPVYTSLRTSVISHTGNSSPMGRRMATAKVCVSRRIMMDVHASIQLTAASFGRPDHPGPSVIKKSLFTFRGKVVGITPRDPTGNGAAGCRPSTKT